MIKMGAYTAAQWRWPPWSACWRIQSKEGGRQEKRAGQGFAQRVIFDRLQHVDKAANAAIKLRNPAMASGFQSMSLMKIPAMLHRQAHRSICAGGDFCSLRVDMFSPDPFRMKF
jgi:hypothetical protein